MIDLHSHTTASDGELSPEALVQLASQTKVRCLAVTDHDTVAGLDAAEAAGHALGVRVISGIELSAYLNRREVHVLGHFIRRNTAELKGFLERFRLERRERMQAMVAKLNTLGIPVEMREIDEVAQGAQLGRPHLARVLVQRKVCRDVKEAFDQYLADGRSAHVERDKLTPNEAIGLIHRAGGTATVAHPGVSKVNRLELEEMKAAGLDGLEVHHADHPPSQVEVLLTVAKELDLVPTAGSDFHGELVSPGRRLGARSMDEATFAKLERRAAATATPADRSGP